MHPVLARAEIEVAELNRRQRLAAAERKRLMAAGIAVEQGGAVPATTRRIRNLVLGAVTGMSPFRASRRVSVPAESAAIRSA